MWCHPPLKQTKVPLEKQRQMRQKHHQSRHNPSARAKRRGALHTMRRAICASTIPPLLILSLFSTSTVKHILFSRFRCQEPFIRNRCARNHALREIGAVLIHRRDGIAARARG